MSYDDVLMLEKIKDLNLQSIESLESQCSLFMCYYLNNFLHLSIYVLELATQHAANG